MKNLELMGVQEMGVQEMGVQEMGVVEMKVATGGNLFPIFSDFWWAWEVGSFCAGVSDGWNENKR